MFRLQYTVPVVDVYCLLRQILGRVDCSTLFILLRFVMFLVLMPITVIADIISISGIVLMITLAAVLFLKLGFAMKVVRVE